jgi:copper chaperone
MEKQTLKVMGMSCGHCKGAVEDALKEIGVTEAAINLEAGTVDVTFDPQKVTLGQMKEAIEEAGYDLDE